MYQCTHRKRYVNVDKMRPASGSIYSYHLCRSRSSAQIIQANRNAVPNLFTKHAVLRCRCVGVFYFSNSTIGTSACAAANVKASSEMFDFA